VWWATSEPAASAEQLLQLQQRLRLMLRLQLKQMQHSLETSLQLHTRHQGLQELQK
jgi:hypothetical protein